MNNIIKFEANLKTLKIFAKQLAKHAVKNDVYLLQGELGSGKTTFSRFFIESLFKKNLLQKPKIINSPTFPILISYKLFNCYIHHYDLYRLKDRKELFELGVNENLINNITVMEWPEIFLKENSSNNYYLINFKIKNNEYREVQIFSQIKKLSFKMN